MILVGNQRGGAGDLAQHLMKAENERIELHDLRGFIADDLHGAFRESYAASRATKCKQHLFSLSLSPPKGKDVSDQDFEAAVSQAEAKLGLVGRPRAIIFHEKRGSDGELRRHAHAVWSRIDAGAGKAVHLAHLKQKLNDVSRDLFRKHEWTLPKGYERHEARDPASYSLAEWQQSKRAGRDPKRTKEVFQDAWAMSDSPKSFAAALRDHGLILARGDRRGFVAMDHKGEAFAVSRYCGLKAKDVRARLGAGHDLPSASEAHREAADRVRNNLKLTFQTEIRRAQEEQRAFRSQAQLDADNARIVEARLARAQDRRATAEEKQREAKRRKGFLGLVDWVTGRKKKIEAENQIAAEQARLRDLKEREAHRKAARARADQLEQQRKDKLAHAKAALSELKDDVRNLRVSESNGPAKDGEEKTKRKARRPKRGTGPPAQKVASERRSEPSVQEAFTKATSHTPPAQPDPEGKKEAFKRKRRATSERPRRRSRTPSRDGPTLDR